MKKSKWNIFTNGIFKENPVLILALGCCSVLAVSVTVAGALGMGVALTFVLVCSNAVISLLRRLIPDQVRIPCFIVVIATFVTLVEMVVEAYLPSLYDSLGIFLALIVVNCIVLGRAEMFACKNSVGDSIIDGLGMGVGYIVVIVGIAIVRELVGSGTIYGLRIIPEGYQIGIITQTPGGFLCFGAAMAVLVYGMNRRGKKFEPKMGCENCAGCAAGGCSAQKTENDGKGADAQ
ncbi:MAG: electron transport complex subunit E [Oscillospiraceae bacterium]|nr:electron transport complex subunit E [Oscillospiraceae bacterium]MCC8157193.1 electron transport complex subunit E [Oscillospiraceae bacterium]